MDKTKAQTIYEIDFDLATNQPKSIKMTVLTGVRGQDGKGDLASQEHVAFHFDYRFDSLNEVASFEVPKPAQKLIR